MMMTSMTKPLSWICGITAWVSAVIAAWAAMAGLLTVMGMCIIMTGILVFSAAFFSVQYEKWQKYVEEQKNVQR